MKDPLMVQVEVQSTLPEVWAKFTLPEAITHWNFASDDWHCPRAINELHIGGRLSWTMAAKDGSMEFDLEGTYDEISKPNLLTYTLADNRKVKVLFEQLGDKVKVTQWFEPENMNSVELQRQGWQAILDNFKKYCQHTA